MILHEPIIVQSSNKSTVLPVACTAPSVTMHRLDLPAWKDEKTCLKCKYCTFTEEAGIRTEEPVQPVFSYFTGVHDFTKGETDPAQIVLIGEKPTGEEQRYGYPMTDEAGDFFHLTWKSMFDSAEDDDSIPAPPPILYANALCCRQPDTGAPAVAVWKRCTKNYLLPLLSDPTIVADDALIVVSGAVAWKAIHSITEENATPSTLTSVHGRPTKLTISGRTFVVIPILSVNYVLTNMDTQRENFLTDFNAIYASIVSDVDVYDVEVLFNEVTQNEILYTEMPPYADLETIVQVMADEEVSGGIVSFDIESCTKNLATHNNKPTLMGFGFGDPYYVQFSEDAYQAVPYIFRRLRDLGIRMSGQTIKFDLISSWRFRLFESVQDLPIWVDTHWLQSLVDENKSAMGKADLKTMLAAEFGWPDYSAGIDSYVKNVSGGNWGNIPLDKLRPYHACDLVGTWKLTHRKLAQIAEEEVSGKWIIDYVDFYSEIDRNLLQMTLNGFHIDVDYLGPLTTKYAKKLADMREFFNTPLYASMIQKFSTLDKPMKEMVNKSLMSFPFDVDQKIDTSLWQFNPNSTDHIRALLASLLDNETKKDIVKLLGREAFSAKGGFSTSKKSIPVIVKSLKEKTGVHEAVIDGLEKIGEYRSTATLDSRYISGMRENIWADNCIRSLMKVAGAATGRLSSGAPNVQNLPRDKEVKNMFTPSKHSWYAVQMDLSQAEVRGLASFSGDPDLAKAYADGLDMHRFVASKVFKVEYDKVTKDQRQMAKPIAFGALYGSGAAGMAASNGFSVQTAQEMLTNYFETFSHVQPWIDEQHRMVENYGYVVGAMGRKRNLPAHMSNEQGLADLKREGQNGPVQMFASDFNLMVMNTMLATLAAQYSEYSHLYKFVNTVHDSLVFECDPALAPILHQVYQESLTSVNTWFKEVVLPHPYNVLATWVDMVGDVEIGPRYGTLYPFEEKINEKTGETDYFVEVVRKNEAGEEIKEKWLYSERMYDLFEVNK